MFYEKKLAELVCEYSLYLKKDDILLIRGEVCAAPLIKEIYAKALQMGVHPIVRLTFDEQESVFYKHAVGDQLEFIPEGNFADARQATAMVFVDATSNSKQLTGADKKKIAASSKAKRAVRDIMMEREQKGEFRWNICPYPTQAMAMDAEMSFDEYSDFVFTACKLNEPDPVAAWNEVDRFQNKVVEILTGTKELHIVGKKTDIKFSVEDRKWLNCNGHHNMPDGEVFTSPVEDSADGEIYFDVPTTYLGVEAGGIWLKIENGKIIDAKAEKGEEFLLSILDTDEGSRLVGEIAFGLNENINKPSKNILFDEKIGRTIHMAVGSSYPEAGGKNRSGIHWDMIKDMNNGKAYKDGVLIFENGKFKGL